MPQVNPSALADYLIGGAKGLNRSILGFADTLVGNPAAAVYNAATGSQVKNPITGYMQGRGVATPPSNPNEAIADAISGAGGTMLTGAVPVAGDVAGLTQDIQSMRSGETPVTPLSVGLTALGALPFVPPLARAVYERLPEGATRRVGDMLGENQQGILAYHGTPHEFAPTENNPLGEFDLSKMGTGEGVQAYGWGQYLAESPDVAAQYRAALSPSPGSLRAIRYKGRDLRDVIADDDFLDALSDAEYETVELLRNHAASNAGGEDIVSSILSGLAPGTKEDVAKKLAPGWDLEQAYQKRVDRFERAKKLLADAAGDIKSVTGSLYTVDLPDEELAKFLDWDGILDDQPQPVKDVAGLWNAGKPGADAFGRDIYREAAKRFGGESAASQALAQRGIPGIRFLDGNSRAEGAGTSNFVVFDTSILKILERNGIPAEALANAIQ